MTRSTVAVWPFLFLLVGVPLRGQDFPADRHALAAALIPEVEALAEWCRVAKLYRESTRLLALLLRLDPDHARARRVLRYRREVDGRWVQSPDFREPQNLSEDKLGELNARKAALLDPYCDRVIEALDRHGASVAPELRKSVLRDLLEIAPEHEGVRRAYLAAQGGGADPVAAKLRRTQLAAAAKDALARVPAPRTVEPSSLEADLGIRWSRIAATDHVRVLASGSPEEASDTATACEAAGALFERCFGTKPRFRDGYTIYLLSRPSEKASILDRHPGVTAELRKFVEPLSGAWIGPSKVIEWHEDEARRGDGAVRQTLATMLFDTFKVTTKQAWASEGFGIYLTWHLKGTRLTWLVQRSQYGGGASTLRQRLLMGSTEWLLEAKTLLQGSKRPDLRTVLTTDVNSMTDEEMLYAYALSAYLLEAAPEQVPEILRLTGAGTLPDDLLRQTLDVTPGELESRLKDWLEATVP